MSEFHGNFTLLTLNSQSLYAKFYDLDIILNHFSEKSVEIGAICIQETWLADNADTSLLNIENFNLITQGYSSTTHGGLALYVNSKYNTEKIISINRSSVCEALFIKLSAGDLQRDLIVGNIYKPPHNNNNNDNIEQFMAEIQPLLDELNKSKADIVCAGDFNIDLLKINQRTKYSEFFDLMIQNNYLPKITLPTRFARHSCSLLDNIYCKLSNETIGTSAGILLNDISDHLLCYSSIKFMSLEDRRKHKKVKQKIVTKKAQNSFIEELKNLNIYDRLNHSLECDPNINYRILMDTVTECRQKHFPSKLVKFNKRRHKSNKWITYGIIKSINTRDEMYRKLLALNINDPRYPELKYNLKIRKSIIKKKHT